MNFIVCNIWGFSRRKIYFVDFLVITSCRAVTGYRSFRVTQCSHHYLSAVISKFYWHAGNIPKDYTTVTSKTRACYIFLLTFMLHTWMLSKALLHCQKFRRTAQLCGLTDSLGHYNYFFRVKQKSRCTYRRWWIYSGIRCTLAQTHFSYLLKLHLLPEIAPTCI